MNKSFDYTGRVSTYFTGGYVFELSESFGQVVDSFLDLEKFSWIDRQTRAVIIEFSTFNPNVNYLARCVIMFEFLPGGSILKSSQIKVVNLCSFSLLLNVINIVYLVFLILIMLRELVSMLKHGKKYFVKIWNYCMWGLIGFSWAAISLYVNSVYSSFDLIDNLSEGNFVDLNSILKFTKPMMVCVSFAVFFATTFVLQLFRANKKISELMHRFKSGFSETICFILIILIFHDVFANFFCSEFSYYSLDFADFLRSFVSVLKLMHRREFMEEIFDEKPVSAPLIVCVYKLIIWFLLVHVFLMLLNNALKGSRNESDKDVDEVLGFVKGSFRKLICRCCMKRRNESKLKEEKQLSNKELKFSLFSLIPRKSLEQAIIVESLDSNHQEFSLIMEMNEIAEKEIIKIFNVLNYEVNIISQETN